MCSTCKIELCKKIFNYEGSKQKLQLIYNDQVFINDRLSLYKRKIQYVEVDVTNLDNWLTDITDNNKLVSIDVTKVGDFYKILYTVIYKHSFYETIIEKIDITDEDIDLWLGSNQELIKTNNVHVYFMLNEGERLFMYIIRGTK